MPKLGHSHVGLVIDTTQQQLPWLVHCICRNGKQIRTCSPRAIMVHGAGQDIGLSGGTHWLMLCML